MNPLRENKSSRDTVSGESFFTPNQSRNERRKKARKLNRIKNKYS